MGGRTGEKRDYGGNLLGAAVLGAGVPQEAAEVSFQGAGGFGIRGTMTRPACDGNRPALLLLPGSGPTDRDGNQPPLFKTNLLKQLAEWLASNGGPAK